MPQPQYLLCTDLDRTLLPNGEAPELADARSRFATLAARPELIVAYVSGRDLGRIEQAIAQYNLPWPDFAVADVGTTINQATGSEAANQRWQPLQSWQAHLATIWSPEQRSEISQLLSDLPLTPQEADRQGDFKQSYTCDPTLDKSPLDQTITQRLAQIPCRCIWSRDDESGERLLDILPRGADKLAAVRMLQQRCQIGNSHTLFAGDSGNDMEVLTSDIPSVLVANAHADIRQQARASVQQSGLSHTLFLPTPNDTPGSGCYGDGILQAFAHYFS
uniref:Putative HAD-superfamily hydrolase n=1 Tax=Magnetococcus massalia (strain MO-1) TaxID=451514 RepID=A0A1S7LL24_MAGMO|nr:putative HAD-superfamily hydrolase [Candidatus Magnetococcus massalia]